MRRDLYINILITFLIGVLTFIVNRVFSDTLGQEALGFMNLMNNLIAYLNVANLGIATASTYALYKPFSNRDYDKISIIISTIDSYYKKIAIFISIIGLIATLYISSIANNLTLQNSIYIYWILYLLNTAVGYLYAKYTVLFIANQEYRFFRVVEGGSRVLIMALQILVLKYTQSFLLFILLFFLQHIISYFLYLKHFKKSYSFIKSSDKRDHSIFINMKNMAWHKVGEIVVFNSDNIILATFTSLNIVAIYSSYMIISQMILTVVGVLTPVLAPRIGAFIAKSDTDKVYFRWRELHSLYIYMATILTLTFLYTVNSFMRLWMGDNYLLPTSTLILLSLNLYILIARGMVESFKNGCGFYNDIYNPILESLINLVLSLLLVNRFGIDGVIIGTVVSNLIVIYILKPVAVFKRCFKRGVREYIRDFSLYSLLSFISSLIIYLIFKEVEFNVNSWGGWIVLLIETVTVLILVVTPIFFIFSRDFRELIKKKGIF